MPSSRLNFLVGGTIAWNTCHRPWLSSSATSSAMRPSGSTPIATQVGGSHSPPRCLHAIGVHQAWRTSSSLRPCLSAWGVDYHLVHQTSVQRLTNEYTYSHAFLIARLCYPILIRRGRPSAELRHRLPEELVLEFVLRVLGLKHLAHLFERLMRRRLRFLARPLGAIKRRSLYLSTRLECAFP